MAFYARTLGEEKQCPDLELNVLESIQDVTDRVNAAVTSNLNSAQAFAARNKVIADIERESLTSTGLHSESREALRRRQLRTFTDINAIPMSAWSLLPRSALLSLEAIPIISNTPGMTWICVFFVLTRTANRPTSRTT